MTEQPAAERETLFGLLYSEERRRRIAECLNYLLCRD